MVKEKEKGKKESSDAKNTIDDLVDNYRKQLEEIFSKDTFNLSFDEREQLISGKMKKETSSVIEQHIEKDPEGISKNNYNPEETCMCPCGTEAVLCRDKDGKPRIFKRELKTKNKPVKLRENGYYCSKCRKVFFPHRKILKTFKENYSPDLLRKITYAGAHSTSSFEEAEENLRVLAEIPISTSHIQRLTIRIGKEYDEQDEQTVALWEDLPDESDSQVEVASVSVDGGRAQTREENHRPGVKNPSWRETKVGCLQVLESTVSEEDPHPMLPKAFKNQETVKHLVEGLKGNSLKKDKDNEDKNKNQKTKLKPLPKEKDTSIDYRPKVREKFVVATIDNADAFGNMVLYKAHQKQLHTAKRKAYLGDGDIKLWTIYEDYFRPEGWTPILDFVHAVEYAFDSAKLSTENESQAWAKYMEFITHIWQGRVLTVIRRLDKTINQLDCGKNSKSKIIQEKIIKLKSIRNYFSNNITRMKYPDYRKNGLPISSCHVESLIKQFNRRIKSTEKFWNRSSLKGILKLKASLLSNDDSFQQFWDNRYEHQVSTKSSYLRKAA